MMFDINGGSQNVFTMMLLISSLVILVSVPAVIMRVNDRSERFGALLGLLMWGLIVYVANPSLTFWKVL